MIGLREVLACAVAASLAGVIAGAPLPARADAPSYAVPGYANTEETIKGTIEDFDGKYHLHLRDVRGFIDDVTLHDGTVINPLGLTLEAGMRVTLDGHADGRTFAADVVDAPEYAYAPAGGYAVAPWPYGYGYGYGPGWWGSPYYGVSLGLAFGFGGWWGGGCCWGGWGGWHGGPWGGRAWGGRSFWAPRTGGPGSGRLRPGVPGRGVPAGRAPAPAARGRAFSGSHGFRMR